MNILIWVGIIVAIFAGLYLFNRWNTKPVEWKPEDVAKLLQTWIDGNIDYAGWDYFEACEIVNPELEKIRLEAIEATWLKSPNIENCGGQNEHLNEKGISKFKELIEKCLALV